MPIKLHDLSKGFDGRPVLVRVNHAFADGAVSCVLGPSGCGKTTLLRILMGLLAPDSGEVTGLPRRCSAVFQEDRLIEHLSAVTNVRVVLRRDVPAARVRDALAEVGLAEALDRPVRELSGGMRRRVAIVRALLADAPLVLMDEPFKGLDAATRDSAIRFARAHLAGRTAIVVTHDPVEPRLLGASAFVLSMPAGDAALSSQ